MQSVRGRRFLGDSVIYRDKLVKNSKIVLNPEGLNYRFDVFDQISRYMRTRGQIFNSRDTLF